MALLLQPRTGAGETSDEGSFHDSSSSSSSNNSGASSLDRSWLSETDEPRFASV